MPRIKYYLSSLVVLCILLTAIGCAQQERRPEKTPGTEGTGDEPTISLYVAETGETKELKMEEYIQGVVAAEMEPDWPAEALAAQAILARTFTMERMASTGGVPERGTDASTDTEEFQAYDPERINERVKEAVEMTRGELVKYKGAYIKAWFFADGGGVTAESAREGLAYEEEEAPYIQSVEDPGYEITAPENKNWQAEFPLSVVREAVRKITGEDPGDIGQVEVLEKGGSGRVIKLQVGSATVSGPALRLALDKEKMRSALLTEIKVEGDSLVMAGKGFGHGVGMSQWGAKALAEQGKSPEEIVNYFYKDVEIIKEWE